ncbi:Fic family protein [Rhizobium sp. BR 314]|uniref:Fic family protein n=1 Tax=Rhizobium sp. BR 314 TaxID=3040013 RepID=UPI0039BFC221
MTANPANPTVFQERIVPTDTVPVGFAALVQKYGIAAPVRLPSCVAKGFIYGSRRVHEDWTIFDKRFAPEDSLLGHLTFALRHETIDLLVLKRLFQIVPASEIAVLIEAEPTSSTTRRIWFFYEWLTGTRLDIPDAERGNYVEALDTASYFTSTPVNSPRHRVRDNLLGTPTFCPVLRRTEYLVETVTRRWDAEAKELIGKIGKGIVARAASFLLLSDSQASYQIEGERPPRSRLERWMRAVAQSGKRPITVDELVRLQHIVIEENRFIMRGLRDAGGFIGDRDWNDDPLPEFVSARHEDINDLLGGIIAAGSRMAESGVDAVLQASVMAFAFVFVHPFEDGNGRLHRYLMHHVLSERGYTPAGMIFPISSVLLERQEEYGARLRGYTGPLLPFIEWVPTPEKNVRVVNDTTDLYRFGDYTELTEFLYACVVQTIRHDLPNEIDHLSRFDEAKRRIQDFLEMPDAMISSLVNFIRQNDGALSKKRRSREFEKMTDEEVKSVEAVVRDAFDIGLSNEGGNRSEENRLDSPRWRQ